MRAATLAKTATASARLVRLMKTAFESVMNWPRRGMYCTSFFAMMLHPFGKILPRSAVRVRQSCCPRCPRPPRERERERERWVAKLTQDVNHRLVVPDHDGRFIPLEVLLALDLEPEPDERRDEPVEASRDAPVGIAAAPHAPVRDRDDDAPDAARREAGQEQREARVVPHERELALEDHQDRQRREERRQEEHPGGRRRGERESRDGQERQELVGRGHALETARSVGRGRRGGFFGRGVWPWVYERGGCVGMGEENKSPDPCEPFPSTQKNGRSESSHGPVSRLPNVAFPWF